MPAAGGNRRKDTKRHLASASSSSRKVPALGRPEEEEGAGGGQESLSTGEQGMSSNEPRGVAHIDIQREWQRAVQGIDPALVPAPPWAKGGGLGGSAPFGGLGLRGGGGCRKIAPEGCSCERGRETRWVGLGCSKGFLVGVFVGGQLVRSSRGKIGGGGCLRWRPLVRGLLRLRGGRVLEEWMKEWGVDQKLLDELDSDDAVETVEKEEEQSTSFETEVDDDMRLHQAQFAPMVRVPRASCCQRLGCSNGCQWVLVLMGASVCQQYMHAGERVCEQEVERTR